MTNTISNIIINICTHTHTHTHTHMQMYYTDTALSLLPSPNQVRLERIGVRDLGKKNFLSVMKVAILNLV